jgi:hypothetical protein
MSQWFHPVAKGYTGMDERPVRLAGKALVWQSIQMGGEKGIFMLRILVLTRLLTPDDFGLIAIATSAMGMLLGLSNMGIVPALIQSQDTNDHHYDAVWTIGVIRAIFIAGIMVVAAPSDRVYFCRAQSYSNHPYLCSDSDYGSPCKRKSGCIKPEFALPTTGER